MPSREHPIQGLQSASAVIGSRRHGDHDHDHNDDEDDLAEAANKRRDNTATSPLRLESTLHWSPAGVAVLTRHEKQNLWKGRHENDQTRFRYRPAALRNRS